MTTPNTAFINPYRDFVLTPRETGGFLDISSASTKETGNYIKLPIGVNLVVISWRGTGRLVVEYYPDGRYQSRRQILDLSTVANETERRSTLTLSIDNPAATLSLSTGAGQTLFRAGVQIINTRLE